jgi:hypothetical protein
LFPPANPEAYPDNVAVTVPAVKFPDPSRATIADAVFKFVAVVRALSNVPEDILLAFRVVNPDPTPLNIPGLANDTLAALIVIVPLPLTPVPPENSRRVS